MFTSLKALKWSYNMGVSRERQRIAAELQLQQSRARSFNHAALDMMRDPTNQKETSKQRKQRLELAMAVNNRIEEIINELFRYEGETWIPGSSVMFPDEGKKK